MDSDTQETISIILVDDDADDRASFAEAIQYLDFPHVLHETGSYRGLLQLLHTQPLPQIIFMDINMPLPNGLECLQQLKEQPEYKLIPVIMYSVSSRKEDIDMAYKSQAHHYIIKPFIATNLRATLRKVFERDWHSPPPPNPSRSDFVIDISYTP